jgi:hypothetical protein
MRTLSRRAGGLAFLAAAVLMTTAPRAAAQWIPYTSDPRNILEGNWQSCPERDGRYAERIYDHIVNGVPQFEVHLGPRSEFAIFIGVQDGHREHNSPENLLKPYRVTMEDGRARRQWDIPPLKLTFTVTLGGGSMTDCDSWYILLKPTDKTSQ